MAQNKIDMSLDDIIKMDPVVNSQTQQIPMSYPGYMNNINNVHLDHPGMKKSVHERIQKYQPAGNLQTFQTPHRQQNSGIIKVQQKGVSPLLANETKVNNQRRIQNLLRKKIQQNKIQLGLNNNSQTVVRKGFVKTNRIQMGQQTLNGVRQRLGQKTLNGVRQAGQQQSLNGARQAGQQQSLNGFRQAGQQQSLNGVRLRLGQQRTLNGIRQAGQQKQRLLRLKIQQNQQQLQGGFDVKQFEPEQLQGGYNAQMRRTQYNNNQDMFARKQQKKLGVKKSDLEELAERSARLAQKALQKMARLERQINGNPEVMACLRNNRKQVNIYQEPIARNLSDDLDNDMEDSTLGDVSCWGGEHINDNITVSVPNSPQTSPPITPRRHKNQRTNLKRTTSMTSVNSTVSAAAAILGQHQHTNKRARIGAMFTGQSGGPSFYEQPQIAALFSGQSGGPSFHEQPQISALFPGQSGGPTFHEQPHISALFPGQSGGPTFHEQPQIAALFSTQSTGSTLHERFSQSSSGQPQTNKRSVFYS